MRKIKFISAIALTLALGACDNFDLPNPPAQSNPAPEGYFENSSLEIEPVTEAINLKQLNADNKYVNLGKITKIVDFPEGYTLEIYMEVGNNAQFDKVVTSPVIIDGDLLTIHPDDFNGLIQSAITREPGTLNVATRFIAYAVRNNTRARLGGVNGFYGQELLSVTTLDYSKVIEDTYYFVPCNASGAPQLAQALKMDNTAGATVSPYDNPEFAIKLDIPDTEDYRFVIAPQSTISAGGNGEYYGCNESEDPMKGALGTTFPAGIMPINGSVFFTVNMEMDTYTVSYAFDVLYPVSGSRTKPANVMALTTENYMDYYGVTALNQLWTIYTTLDKTGVRFNVDSSKEPVLSENGLEMTGFISSAVSAQTQIPAPIVKNCLYYVDVNLVSGTFSLKAMETLTVIGAGNDWNLETAVALTPSSDLKTWTATDVEIGAEFKINANGAWDYDFGGTKVQDSTGEQVYNITFKGGNMQAEPGKYDVKIDFSTIPYVLTLTKK